MTYASDEFVRQHVEEWRQQLISVGVDESLAGQVIAMAVLNGLFEIPKDWAALREAHSCGNTVCVNPRHLSWKTPSENQLDRTLHGTQRPKGFRYKLTLREVAAIRRDHSRSHGELAAAFNVCRRTIGMIKKGQTWKQAG